MLNEFYVACLRYFIFYVSHYNIVNIVVTYCDATQISIITQILVFRCFNEGLREFDTYI